MANYLHHPICPRVGLDANLAAASAVTNEILWTSDTFALYVEQGGDKKKVGPTSLDDLGVTATASEINILDGVTATAGDINVACIDATAGIKAWLVYNQSLAIASIIASKNVSSVTDNSTGNFTINFDNSLSTSDYCWHANSRDVNDIGTANGCAPKLSDTKTKAAFQLQVESMADGTNVDSPEVCVMVFL